MGSASEVRYREWLGEEKCPKGRGLFLGVSGENAFLETMQQSGFKIHERTENKPIKKTKN